MSLAGYLDVPELGKVPVYWMPASDEDFKDKSEGARSGYKIEAFVLHRAVANTLHGIDVTFAAGDDDPATVGSAGRSVSSNFAVGDKDGGIAISQYVDVSDTAYCNGDCSQTKYGSAYVSNFDKWYSHKGHNERTLSIEHDDNGGSTYEGTGKRGVVTENILKASVALVKLLKSGDIDAIRAAGIKIRDQASADQLKAIVPKRETILDHKDIAGKGKPYCWRAWKDDKVGIPRQRYIDALTAVPEPTSYTKEQVDEAVKSATDPLNAQIADLGAQLEAANATNQTLGAKIEAARAALA